MDLKWYESILYGLISGLTDILPVSAQAHKILLLKLFGASEESGLLRLLMHLGILAAVYYSCQTQIIRIVRAKNLARIPKRRRKRPLDTRSLMDFSLWKTMLIPVIIGLLCYEKASAFQDKLVLVSAFLFINGVILYIPQFLPGSNKDSRMMSRVEGFLMGLGGAASVLPGISGIGAALSIGSVCGVERNYALNMSLLMSIAITVGLVVYDVMAIISGGIGAFSFGILLTYLLAAAAAFGGAMLGIKIMRSLAANNGFSLFGYYCWGLALFTFILNLMA